MKRFTTETMAEIMAWLADALREIDASEVTAFEVPDPDYAAHRCAGETCEAAGVRIVCRGYKAWCDLAELHLCRLLTPERAEVPFVRLRLQKLDPTRSFHRSETAAREKYGAASEFFAIRKDEEPSFAHPYLHALERVEVGSRARVLDLGVNRGDEFETIRRHLGSEAFSRNRYVGVDHSRSAIEQGRARFDGNVELHAHDINDLDALGLGRFDLIISIGTLQSPGIEFKPFFMALVQRWLSEEGAIILGFPNCRWMDGEMIYGAKAPNYAYSEMSLLFKDVYFCKKYLQQHRFRVTLTGSDYVFLTATRIGTGRNA